MGTDGFPVCVAPGLNYREHATKVDFKATEEPLLCNYSPSPDGSVRP